MDYKGLINANIALLADATMMVYRKEERQGVDGGYNYFKELLKENLSELTRTEARGVVDYLLNDLLMREIDNVRNSYQELHSESASTAGIDRYFLSRLVAIQQTLNLVNKQYMGCKKLSFKDLSIEEVIGELFGQHIELDNAKESDAPTQLVVWNKMKLLAGKKFKNSDMEAQRYFKTLPYRNGTYDFDVKKLGVLSHSCDVEMDTIVQEKIPQNIQAKMCALLKSRKQWLDAKQDVSRAFYEYSQSAYNDPLDFVANSSMFKEEPNIEVLATEEMVTDNN